MMRLLTASLALCFVTVPAHASEKIARGFHLAGKAIWTHAGTPEEVLRFPIASDDPTFTIWVEFQPKANCPPRSTWFECAVTDQCVVYFTVPPEELPLATNGYPYNSSDEIFVLAMQDEPREDGGYIREWPYESRIVSRNGEMLRVENISLMLSNQQCWAGVKAEYHKSHKADYNRWPR